MRILLTAINAKYIHSNLAVYNLKAVTAKYGDQIEIAEYTINQQPDEILADIYKKQPDVIAFSTYIWNRRMVGELITELSKVLSQAEIWAGGPEVSYDAEAFLMEYPKVRGVMRGEGETVFPALATLYIEGTGSFQTIAGITYRNNHGELQINEDGAPANMDELPFVYGHLEDFSHKIIYYESSRGCPFRCAYCLSSLEKKLRFRSLDLVKKELGFFLQAKVPQVKFLDRTFNCNPRRTVDLWQWILDHDNGITNFHFEIAADLITEEELAIMEQMRPGLIQLEIGVQSTNMETVHEIDRVMDLDLVRNVTAKVKSFGNIHQHLDLIAGLPGEDLDSFHKSFDEPTETAISASMPMNGWTMKSCTSISIRKRSWRHSPPFSKIAFQPNKKREVRHRVKRDWNLVSCPVCPLYLWATVVSSGGRTSVQNQISAASKQTTPTVALPKSNR